MVILDQVGDGLEAVSAIVKTGANVISQAGSLKCKEMENSYVLKTIKKAEKVGINLKTENGRKEFKDLKSAVLSL